MHILIIGTDQSFLKKQAQLGDAIERHLEYARYVDSLDIVVYAPARLRLSPVKLSEKLTAWPSDSLSKLTFFFDALKLFKRINRRRRIDIVVCQDPFIMGLVGCYLKKKYGIKLQINFHGDFWQNKYWLRERWLNYFFWLLSRFTVPRADAIRVMSPGQKKKLVQAGLPAEKIFVIATPVNLNKFLHCPSVNLNSKKHKIILHVGRDDKVKDYPTLLKAFSLVAEKMPDVRLYQAGADKYMRRAMRDLPSSVKEKIIIKGRLPHEQLLDLYSLSELVVLSSFSESFGKVLVEANACAKPVVSTATTGAQAIIQDGYNGFLAPIGDAEKLAAKILQLLTNPVLARQMGRQGRELVKRKFADNTQKIVQLWQYLAAGR